MTEVMAATLDALVSVRLSEEHRQMLEAAREQTDDALYTDRSDSWLIRKAIEESFGRFLAENHNGEVKPS